FAGRRLAERLHEGLAAASAACTRLTIVAATSEGGEYSRTWRCAEPLTAAATADRVRWQMDGWLGGTSAARPTGPVVLLRLEPVEVAAAGDLQAGLFGGSGAAHDRAGRAVSRVQGLLGGDAVMFGAISGGRGAGGRVTMLTWGEQPAAERGPSAAWPGRLPAPSPSVLVTEGAELQDAAGGPVGVTGRGAFTAVPAMLLWRNKAWEVTGWAGPWPVDEHWWDPSSALRAARAQVLARDGPAVLLLCRGGAWTVEGVYG